MFPRPVNLIEIGSQRKKGAEREDTDGGKGRHALRNRRKGGNLKEDKSLIGYKQALSAIQNRTQVRA